MSTPAAAQFVGDIPRYYDQHLGPIIFQGYAEDLARRAASDTGREALLPEARPLAPGSEPVVVRGKLLAHGRLRVIDAETNADLRGIEVRCAEGWRGNPLWTHPGDDERIASVLGDAASLFELPDRKWLTPYWVHAPGHAWFPWRSCGSRDAPRRATPRRPCRGAPAPFRPHRAGRAQRHQHTGRAAEQA